jgi:hypothetical protein
MVIIFNWWDLFRLDWTVFGDARILLREAYHIREHEPMKGLYVILVILSLFVAAASVWSSTLDNTDGHTYLVEVRDSVQTYEGTIPDRSTVALCAYTCQLTLPQTGQSLTVQPDDHVIIDGGVMRVVH